MFFIIPILFGLKQNENRLLEIFLQLLTFFFIHICMMITGICGTK